MYVQALSLTIILPSSAVEKSVEKRLASFRFLGTNRVLFFTIVLFPASTLTTKQIQGKAKLPYRWQSSGVRHIPSANENSTLEICPEEVGEFVKWDELHTVVEVDMASPRDPD